MLLLEDKLFCRNRRIGCVYLNESVKSLISICGLMRSYNILYTASRIGMLTCMWIDFLHTLGAEISFCNHLHLYLRTLHAVALAYHGSEGAVAGKVAVTCYKQVAQIN